MTKAKNALLLSIFSSLFFIGCDTSDPDNEDSLFVCDNGNCVEDLNGSFSSLSECQSSCPNTISVTAGAGVMDIDGNSYETVVYGNGQEWMTSNLKVTKRPDGLQIPNITDQYEWENAWENGWAYYNNDSQNANQGLLYKRSSAYGACPTGWSLPSKSEWSELILYLDPNASETTGESTVAGGMMKEAGVLNWASPNTGGTNESGFTALPGGSRSSNGVFSSTSDLGAAWWSSTNLTGGPNQEAHAHGIFISYDDASVEFNEILKIEGRTVRCIKD